jgi:homogentisate phytyltransferase/homogentisate geranylgeranyltransferase
MAIQSPADLTVRTLMGVLQAIVPALCMNVCIVGFNQVCDVEIDKASATTRRTSRLRAR